MSTAVMHMQLEKHLHCTTSFLRQRSNIPMQHRKAAVTTTTRPEFDRATTNLYVTATSSQLLHCGLNKQAMPDAATICPPL